MNPSKVCHKKLKKDTLRAPSLFNIKSINKAKLPFYPSTEDTILPYPFTKDKVTLSPPTEDSIDILFKHIVK